MNRIPSRRAAILAALLSCLLLPAVFLAQGTGPKALVVCPPTDAAGCDRIATQLALATNGGSPVFPGGVDKKYTELRTMSLSQLQSYSAVFVPSLANAPYELLREDAVRTRLQQVLRGRVAVWSGTPDRGTTSGASAGKLTLIQNLGRWAAGQHAVDGSAGLVVLQDFSDNRPDGTSPRYDWVQGISGVVIQPDLAARTYAQVERNAANPAATPIVGSLAYENMASFGLQLPQPATQVGAWGQTVQGKKTTRGQVVLATAARSPGACQVAGPAGGTLSFQGGKVALAFPSGTLSENWCISVLPTGASQNGYVANTAYGIAPSLGSLSPPVALTISYAEGDIPGGVGNEYKLVIFEFTGGSWVEVPGSVVDMAANTVTNPGIDHLGQYAVFISAHPGGGGGDGGKPVGSVTVEPATASVASGGTQLLTATVRDKNGSPLSGRTVAWTTTGGSLSTASSTTDNTGKATTTLAAPATPGPVTVTAASGGRSGTATVTVNSGPAAKLVYVSGDGGSAAAGSSRTIEAKVTDASDNPVAGHTVNWAATAGGGSVSAATSQTSSSGVASVTWTFGTAAGAQTATASASGPGGALAGSPVTYNATATAGDAARLAVTTQPSPSAQAGAALATQPVVQVQDANGNPVSQAGVTVTAALGSGTGTLGGTATATTNAGGQASFTNLSICGAPGAFTLAFTAASYTAASSNTITLSAGTATGLAIHAGDSQSAPAGSAVAVAPAVKATDACGNPVSGVSVTFAVASGGGSVTGSPATTGADGIATVGSWTLGAAAGANTLEASAAGLTTVTFTATGTAGAAATLTIHAGDGQTAMVGAAVATAPAVRVTDSNGNPTAGVQVTFTASGNGSVTGSPATTDANGVATLGSWTLATTAGANTLTASATGLGSVQLSAAGTAGPAASMTKTAGDGQSAPAGTAVPVVPQVTVSDQYGNPVAGVSVTFTPSTGGAVTGSPATTAANGTATVGSWTLAPATGPNTLTASAAGVSDVQFTATGTAGAPAKLALTTQPSSTVRAGVVFPQQPVVQVQDANGISVSQAGIEVTVQIASGGGTLGGSATATTNASGQATFGGLSIGGTAGSRTLSFSATGMAGVTSGSISVTAGPAAALAFTAQPTTVAVSATITPAVTVAVVDAFGNTVTDATDAVTLAIGANPAGGTLTGGGPVGPAGGVATFSGLSIDKVGTGYTLAASAAGLTGATSSTFDVTPGPVHHFVVEAAGGGPIGAQLVGTAFNVRVTAQDQYNNTATGFTGTVGFTSTPSGGISAGAASGAFVAGVLTSHGITFGTSGSFTLTATRAGGSEAGTSDPFEVQAPPTAVNDGPASNSSVPGDAYHGTFNSTFSLAAPGLKSNDTPGFPVAAVTSFGADSLGGSVTTHPAGSTVAPLPGHTSGSLTVSAEGAVTFTPPTGFTGNYVFRYRLTNARGTSDAQVTIAVGVRPAAVNDTYGPTLIGNVPINTARAGGTGFTARANDKGDALTATLVSATNGTATVNADGTITFAPNAGYEGPATITYKVSNGFGDGPANATVALTVGEPIWFVKAGPTNGNGTLPSPFNCLTSAGCASEAARDANDRIFLYSGTYMGGLTLQAGERVIGQGATASLGTVAGQTWPADADVEPATGGTAPTIVGAGAGLTALTLANVGSPTTANNLLRGFDFGSMGSSGTALGGTSFGTLTVSEVGINTTGQALNLTTGTISGGFPVLRSTGGTNNVSLTGVGGGTSGSPILLGTSADVLSGAASAAFKIDGGTGSFTYAGSITNLSSLAVDIANKTGGAVMLSGDINPSAAGKGISASGNSGGTAITFSGANQKINPGVGTARGVALTNNSGATISFTGGGLAITTDDGNGFEATGGGTVIVDGATDASTIVSSGGIALNVANTTIGAGGLNFRSISATGGSSGIVLNNTGSTAGLTVAGTGAAGTGGTIQNTTGDGVRLASTRNVSLNWMNFSGIAGAVNNVAACNANLASGCESAVDMDNATGVTLNRLSINGAGQTGISAHNSSGLTVTNTQVLNAGNADGESGILLHNLSGTSLIQDVTVDNPEEFGIKLFNTTGTAGLTLRRVTVQNNIGTFGEAGFQAEVSGGTTTVLVDDSDFLNTDGSGVFGTSSASGVLNLTVQASFFTNNQALPSGINFTTGGTSTGRLTATGNTISGCATLCSQGMDLDASIGSTLEATVLNNTITNAGIGTGIEFISNENSVARGRFEGNNVTVNPGEIGFNFHSRSVGSTQSGSLDLTLKSNTLNGIVGTGGAFGGMTFQVGSSGALVHNNSMCVNLATAQNAGSNVVNGTNSPPLVYAYTVRQRPSTTFRFQGYTGAASSATALEAFITSNNPGGTMGGSAEVYDASATTAVNYTSGTCATPSATPTP